MEELFENKNIVYMSATEVFQINTIKELKSETEIVYTKRFEKINKKI